MTTASETPGEIERVVYKLLCECGPEVPRLIQKLGPEEAERRILRGSETSEEGAR